MKPGILVGVGSALAWFAFPLMPTLLGSTYHQTMNWSFGSRGGPDPRDWGWGAWVLLMGPLLGYGFLAGATIGLPDDPAVAGRGGGPRGGRAGWPSGPGSGSWAGRASIMRS